MINKSIFEPFYGFMGLVINAKPSVKPTEIRPMMMTIEMRRRLVKTKSALSRVGVTLKPHKFSTRKKQQRISGYKSLVNLRVRFDPSSGIIILIRARILFLLRIGILSVRVYLVVYFSFIFVTFMSFVLVCFICALKL